MTQSTLKMPAPPQGVIAALAAGFEAVNARLELLLLPLALDLFLWLGPRVSVEPLVQRLLSVLTPPPGADAAMLANIEFARAALSEFSLRFNAFSLLSTAPLGLPSLLAARAPVGRPGGAPIWLHVDSVLLFVLLFGVFSLVGLFLGALYLGGIAQQVRDRRVDLGRLLRQVWGDWARLTALALLAIVLVVLLGTPVALVAGTASLFSPFIGQLLWVGGVTLVLWTLFFGAFAVHGMLLHRRGMFGALWDSVRLVQVNLPHAAGLLVLVVLVNVGLSLLWNLPVDDSWFLLLGLGGHALVSTALVAATFVFYQDRYRWWMEMRRVLQARAEADNRGAAKKA